MITLREASSISATCSTVVSFTLPAGAALPAAGLAPLSAPKPPRITLRIERFIALHMM